MKEALAAMNALVEEGTISMYAIGGAVGAAFYIEAVQTEDVDAFVFLPAEASGLLTLAPIYEALARQGGIPEGEHVKFGGLPLQILPDTTPLVAEAIRNAGIVAFEGVSTRVFTAEHLCCIAVETGRSKDLLRVRMFLEQGAVDRERLLAMAVRFRLESKLRVVEEQLRGDA